MNKIRLILSFSTALAVQPLFAQQAPDNGMNERRLKLPPSMEKSEEPAINEPQLKSKLLTPPPKPAKKPESILSRPVTDEQGLRQTLSDKTLSTRREAPVHDEAAAQRARFQAELTQGAKGGIGAKKDEKKNRKVGPLMEMMPKHPMASAAHPRTGIPAPKTDLLDKKTTNSLSNIAKKNENHISQRRTIRTREALIFRRNSPLQPIMRAIPAKPYDVPMVLSNPGSSVANPLARGVIIDPVSGLSLQQLKILREISPTGLSVLSRDQASLAPFTLDNEAFTAQGVRNGAFILRPSLDLSTGFDDNLSRSTTSKKSASFITARAGMSASSDFTRHALNVDVNGSMSAYSQNFDSYRPTFNATVSGRVDIRHDQSLNLDARYRLSSLAADDTENITGVTMLGEPLTQTIGAGAAYNIDFNRLLFSLKGTLDRTSYDTINYSDNTSIIGSDRAYNTGRLALRGTYKHSEEVRPFVEAFTERRAYDVAHTGLVAQGADAYGAKLGVRFDKNKRLVGEIAVGYALRKNNEPTLADLRGLIFDAGLIWAATGLTNVTLKGGTSFDETAITGVSTLYKRDVSVQIDHAFRRFLIGSARIGVGYDTYEGSAQITNRQTGSLGLAYKFTRDLSVASEIRHTRFNSNTTGNYNSTLLMVGVKLAR